ncbi:hypothetical protein BHU11_06735 [Tannerella sp. oral taxon 808]|nr:hypothetical protein BHU11_06735 [Tannerella sp. oral taxon 808]
MSGHKAGETLGILSGSGYMSIIPLDVYIVVSSHPDVLFTLIIDLHIVPKEDVALIGITRITQRRAALSIRNTRWHPHAFGIGISAQLDVTQMLCIVSFESQCASQIDCISCIPINVLMRRSGC